MRIYLIDDKKITKFVLPSTGEDFFSYEYTNSENNINGLITFEKNNDNWLIKSNGVVNVYNNGINIDNTIISEYEIYNLKIVGKDGLLRLCGVNDVNEKIYKLDISNINTITIGTDPKNNICYNLKLVAPIQVSIEKKENNWILKSIDETKYRVYVNNYRVFNKRINSGDVIFIDGFRMIWMKDFVIINNPKQLVKVTGIKPYNDNKKINNTNYDEVSEEDKRVSLYTDDEYFYHTPRIQEMVEEEEIEIESPPPSQVKEDTPWLLTIGSSVTMTASSFMMGWNVVSSIQSGQRTVGQSIPQIIMCGAMVFGSLIMPRVVSSFQKKRTKEKEALRVGKFSAYLDKKEKQIDLIVKKQAQIMRDNSLSASNCKQVVLSNSNRNFWSREISDDDFLSVRLGIGSIKAPIKINAPIERFSLEEDGLLERVLDIAEKFKKVDNVPINISLLNKHISAFICHNQVNNAYLDNVLLQLVALHSAADLKIVIFTNEINASKWEYAKFLPHCWSEDKNVRYFATNLDEYKAVSSVLEEEYKRRKNILDGKTRDQEENLGSNIDYKVFDTYYLVVCDCYKNNIGIPIIDSILKQPDKNLGFSFSVFTDSMKNLPAECKTFIEVGQKEGCILERNISAKNQQVFTVESDSSVDMRLISNKLLNVPLLTKEGLSVLPQSLSFLEMYGVSKIEQLNILNRWKTNNPVTSLNVPVGVHANGEQFKLNLHEKYHGPHGLIAGMTGSGKSEFIITYILSMCVNYHPYEVQFVLIDYKGGGLAGAFQNNETGVKIPHLVGTITNLDTSEMNRTLVSIESELKRRQRIFNETKDMLGESTIDIYKYQRLYREGAVKEPLAHLFIISDEFAELKAQQPEFMAQLISTARIGRSLGVHLILATQKPTGVVNDQIWSNSKFKICLKVQDRGDSMEMLKKPDAASIKETGRFFLQVGYDDYFDKGQSGWAGAKYVPTDTILKKVDDSIEFINNTGDITRSIKDIIKVQNETNDNGDQLTNIVKLIHSIGQKENVNTHSLWLESIPEYIYVDKLKKKYNYKPSPYIINPVIGEYDKPDEQEQGLFNVNLTEGNAVIWGQNGSGKENLLSTLIWSTAVEHTPQEVNMYIIDCGAESLKMFSTFPHVGAVADVEETEKIVNTFMMIDEELQNRKDLMVEYGGSYKEYLKNSGKKLPLIVVIINNYEIFTENYSKLSESIQTFYRDGAKYGIVFVVSSIATNTIRPRMLQNFVHKLCLQIPNQSEYRNIMNAPKGLFPAKFFGRGLFEVDGTALEFQTAYFCDRKNMVKIVKSASEQFNTAYKHRALPIVVMPDVVYASTLNDNIDSLNNMPIGIGMLTKEPLLYDFTLNKVTPILASKFGGEKIVFVKTLIDMFKKIDKVKVNIIDFTKTFEGVYKEDYYCDNFDEALASLNNYIMSNKKKEEKNINVIIGVGLLKNKLSEKGIAIINNIFNNLPSINNSYFVFVDSYSSYKNLQTEIWYQSNIDSASGIWLGEDVGNQMVIGINNLSLEDRKNMFPYIGFSVIKGEYRVFKHVVEDGVNKDE